MSSSKDGWILKSPNPRSPQRLRHLLGPNLYQAHLPDPKLLHKVLFLQIRPTKPISKRSKNKQLKHCLNLQIQTQMKKTQLQAQPSNKMKTCVMGSHTLPSNNGNLNSIFKSLCSREIKGSKIPRHQIFQITIDHFEEDSWNEIIQMVEDSLKILATFKSRLDKCEVLSPTDKSNQRRKVELIKNKLLFKKQILHDQKKTKRSNRLT